MATRQIGCPACGSPNIRQIRHTTGGGWALFIIGLVLALFTFGLSLVLCFGAMFMTARRAKCGACKWVWTA